MKKCTIILAVCSILIVACSKSDSPPAPAKPYVTAAIRLVGDEHPAYPYQVDYDSQGRIVRWGLKSSDPTLPDRLWEVTYGAGVVTIARDSYIEGKGGFLFSYIYTMSDGKVVSMNGKQSFRKGDQTLVWEEHISAKATYDGPHLKQWVLIGVDSQNTADIYSFTTNFKWTGDNCTQIAYHEEYNDHKSHNTYDYTPSTVPNNLNIDWLSICMVQLPMDQSLRMAQLFGLTGAFTAFIPANVQQLEEIEMIKRPENSAKADDDKGDDGDTSDNSNDGGGDDNDKDVDEPYLHAYTVTATDSTIVRIDKDGVGMKLRIEKR